MDATLTVVEEHEVYPAIGHDGFARLIASFYRRIPTDPVLGPMYAGRDLAAAETRLRDFLIGRFGGPQTYIENRGHPRLRMRHAPFAIDRTARDHWLALMSQAFADTQLPAEPAAALQSFFDSTTEFLLNRP